MGFDLTFERDAAHPAGYYRWSVWGMAWAVDVMRRADLLSDDEPELPPDPLDGLEESEAFRLDSLRGLVLRIWEEARVHEIPLRAPSLRELFRTVAGLIADDFDGRILDRLGSHESAMDDLLAREAASPGKIPAHKFGSNESWLVTPAECVLIATGLRRALAAQGDALFPSEQPTSALAEAIGEHFGAEPPEAPEPEEARRWIDDWIAYNEIASEHGGYRVR